MSHYINYIKERLGDEVVERHEGFATYRYIESSGVKSVYIVDIYVHPDYRKTGVASQMAYEIEQTAKENGCKQMIGTVSTTAKNVTDSIKVLLAYGMTFQQSNEHALIFKKEI